MSNSYFQFKQFRIEQDRCAMKVSTDACILGAYTPVQNGTRILDIGTGTSLLALMLAQRADATIDAIELDEESCLQAKENVAASKWSNRIKVLHADAVVFSAEEKYDLIICNPPFFEKHLKAASEKKNKAKHADALSFEQLIACVKGNLQPPHGIFSVLLPMDFTKQFIDLASLQQLHVQQQLLIRDDAQKKIKRAVSVFSLAKPAHAEEEILSIKNEDGNYSERMVGLVREFYVGV